jgi:hypothetical protein
MGGLRESGYNRIREEEKNVHHISDAFFELF